MYEISLKNWQPSTTSSTPVPARGEQTVTDQFITEKPKQKTKPPEGTPQDGEP